MKRLGTSLLAAVLAAGLAACSTTDATTGDAGADGNLTVEGGTPGSDTIDDITILGESLTGDGPQAASCDASFIGKACTQKAGGGTDDCGTTTGMSCLRLTSSTTVVKNGVCVCSCTADDSRTPLLDEDTCPNKSKFQCSTLQVTTRATPTSPPMTRDAPFCMQKCTPALNKNDCDGDLACTPRSTAITRTLGQAVCINIGCKADTDCNVTIDTKCKVGSTTCGTGNRCLGLTSTTAGSDGICARPGACDKASGLCSTRTKTADFKATAKVGDMCKADVDCGANATCLIGNDEYDETTKKAKLKGLGATCTANGECCGTCTAGKCTAATCWDSTRNGYCVIQGCTFASTLKDKACPAGSGCSSLFFGGFCFKSCTLGAKEGTKGHCRYDDVAKKANAKNLDLGGDYACRDWSGLSIGTTSISKGPLCEWGTVATCSTFGTSTTLSCATLGGTGNKTKVDCRDIETGKAKTNKKDPLGFCLGDAAPSGKWIK